MASLSSFRYLTAVAFLVLYFRTLSADFNVSFASDTGDKDSNWESMFSFYGDAKLASSGMPVRLSGSAAHSAGRVVYKHPVELVGGNPRQLVSFETKFAFSLSSEEGDGLAFVVSPIGYPVNVVYGGSFGLLAGGNSKFLAVEFDTLRDDKYGDLNSNHVGIDVASLVSVKISNLSSINLTLNSGKKLHAWIDYRADSQTLEVRLAEQGETKPLDPLLSYPVNLPRIWDETEVVLSLSSASGNSVQECNLYSWSLKIRSIPHWMHSLPVDPNLSVEKKQGLPVLEKRECTFRVLGALVLGIGCGALGALIVLFIWTIVGYKRPVVPEDYAEQRPLEYEYKKAKIVDKSSTGKN